MSLLRPLMIGAALGKGGGGTAISRLFTAGVPGYTMIPGVDRYAAQFSERTGAAATTACAADDPVGTHKCKLTNRYFAASADARRPLFKPAAFRHSFDGSDDCLVGTEAIDFTATDKITVWKVTAFTNTSTHVTVELSADAVNNEGSFVENYNAQKQSYGLRGNGSITGFNQTANGTSGVQVLSTTVYDLAGASRTTEVVPTINGAAFAMTGAGAADAGGGNFGNHISYIGARGNASLRHQGTIGGLIVLGRAATPAEIANVNAELAEIYGLTLS